MKTKNLKMMILLAVASIWALPAMTAKDEAKEQKVGKRALKKYDADKDGRLNDEEKAAWEADKAKSREERAQKKAKKSADAEAAK